MLLKKMFSAFCIVAITTPTVFAKANDETLFGTSVEWRTSQSSMEVFKSIPTWTPETIKEMFSIFKQDPFVISTPAIEHNKYHVNFINFHWGPLKNPYTNYKRPGKIFVFVGDHPVHGVDWNNTKDNYFVAIIIKNSEDQQYYIFDAGSPAPVLLENWMRDIVKIAPKNQKIRINTCSLIATEPNHICGNTPYETEANFVYSDFDIDDSDLSIYSQKHISAHRESNQDWRKLDYNYLTNEGSIRENAVEWNDINARNKQLNKLHRWPDYTTVKSIFETIRDVRYFTDYKDPSRKRRISWLLVYEGCESRAAAFIKDFFGSLSNPVNRYERPSKIYAFGNLCMNTPYSDDGYIDWWYHAAPIIRDNVTNTAYVLDPSVEPHNPITVNDWIARISDTSGACSGHNSSVNKISICNGYGLYPHHSCEHADISLESYGMLMQRRLQRAEFGTLEDLGFDANKLLGDTPPWEKG